MTSCALATSYPSFSHCSTCAGVCCSDSHVGFSILSISFEAPASFSSSGSHSAPKMAMRINTISTNCRSLLCSGGVYRVMRFSPVEGASAARFHRVQRLQVEAVDELFVFGVVVEHRGDRCRVEDEHGQCTDHQGDAHTA